MVAILLLFAITPVFMPTNTNTTNWDITRCFTMHATNTQLLTCCIVYTYVLLHAYIISLILTAICIKLTNISIVNVWHWHGHFIRTLVCTNIGPDRTFFTFTTAAHMWQNCKLRQALYRGMLRFSRTISSAFSRAKYITNINISTSKHIHWHQHLCKHCLAPMFALVSISWRFQILLVM